MTNRTVVVSLTAQVANYVANMNKAGKATEQTAAQAEHLQQQLQMVTSAGVGLTAFGALAAAGVGLAVKKFADFDQAMSNVSAATNESEKNMGLLRDAALDAGARTVFSATEAANAIEELGKAGLSTSDILNGGLDGALALAASSGLGVADAAGIAATTLKTFNLEGEDASHVADLLAAGAGKAMGDVSDLGMALQQTGLVANSTGLTIEETTTALAAFASQGLLGSDAGTSFKTMLGALTPNSAKAADEMARLGVSAYDAQGNFIGLQKFAGNLKTSLSGLTDEQRNASLEIMFGADAVRAATVLYEEGAAGIGDWAKKVNDAGYAADMANRRMDNLKGDVEQLGGAFDTALIKSGSAANGVLRGLVQAGTDMLAAYGALPLPIQQFTFSLGGLVAVAALTGGAFLIAVPKIAQFQMALAALRTSEFPAVAAGATRVQGAMTKTGAAIGATAKFLTGPWGLALVAASVGVAIFSKALENMQASASEIQNSIKTANSADDFFSTLSKGKDVKWLHDVRNDLRDLPAVLKASADQADNLFARFDSSNFGAFDALKEAGTEIAKIAATDLPGAQKAFRLLTAETDGTEKSQWRLLNALGPDYMNALRDQATNLGLGADKATLLKLAFGDATPSAYDAADAYLNASEQAGTLQKTLADLIATVNEANGVGQDAVSANIDYGNAMAELDEVVRKAREGVDENKDGVADYAATLDQATQAGRDNMDMLVGVAASGQEAAKAQFALDGNTQNYVAALQANRDKVLQNAKDLGATDEQLKFISDHIVSMPSQKEIEVIAKTAEAQRKFDELIAGYQNKTVTLRAVMEASDNLGRARGGILPGAPSRTDNMLIHAASGEYVVNAAQTARNRSVLEYINSGGVVNGYADVGQVRYAASSGAAPAVNVAAPSLEGMRIQGTLDLGNGLTGVIDGRIAQADKQKQRTSDRGFSGVY